MDSDAEPGPVRDDTYRPGHEVDLRRTLHPLYLGAGDPTFRWAPDGFWHAFRTPDGPATIRVRRGERADRGAFRIRTWGPGAEWALASVPDLLGARDDWTGLDLSGNPRLAELRHRIPGLRLTRTGRVFSALVPSVLGQKTTGRQARDSFRSLIRTYGTGAPGPVPEGLLVEPTPAEWGGIPSWGWHRAGVEPARSRTIVTPAAQAGAIDRLAHFETGDPRIAAALLSLRGVGGWTAAETVQRSHGDPDAVSVGDYHLSHDIGWALIGRPVDDDGMLELLEPWRGHRQRIVRLIEASGVRQPRRGARLSIQDHRGH
jgi:3-methyladenine DNA glycosylase/8-oxoguanine DNA glycosylase